jgi:hypothetical protein
MNKTNSILEIRLAIYCQIFEEMNTSFFFTIADLLRLRVVTLLILM